jgi:hypothetical protein
MGQYSQYSTISVLGYRGTEQKTYSLQRYASSVALLRQCVSWSMRKMINVNIYIHLSSVKTNVNTCWDTRCEM